MEFRRPLGLALSGAGSLGAWQAGALEALGHAGARFDRAWGFSAGALNAAAAALGLLREASEMWRDLGSRRLLALAPSQWPRALFSDRPLRELLSGWAREPEARERCRFPFHVASLDAEQGIPFVAAFEPPPGGRWDGPLLEHLVASCSVPRIWPPVRMRAGGRPRTLLDGGVKGRQWLDLEPLKDCRDILSLSVVRPDELGERAWTPWTWFNLKAKRLVHRQMSEAHRSLGAPPEAPRIFRVVPSRALRQLFLDFDGPRCREAHRLGLRDAQEFLAQRVAP